MTKSLPGLIVPFNQPGNTHAGMVTVLADAVVLPRSGRADVIDRHTKTKGGDPVHVGQARDLKITAQGVEGVIDFDDNPDGQAAYEAAMSGQKPGLSAEFDRVHVHRADVTTARLLRVAHVDRPAFPAALLRVTKTQKTTTTNQNDAGQEK